MNSVDTSLMYGAITALVLAGGLLVISLLHTAAREPSKIEHFNIMCANSEGPTFAAEKAKNYDVRGNLLEVTSPTGEVIFYEVPPHVMCVVVPVITEELPSGSN